MPDETMDQGLPMTPPVDEASSEMATAPPPATPSAAPMVGAGEAEQAKANVQLVIGLLEQALPYLGSHTPEGQAVLNSLGKLTKVFAGKPSQDLAPAELLSLMSGMPESYKGQAAQELGAGQPAGIPEGAHVPANLNA